MKFILCCLLDSSSGILDSPVPFRTEAEAMRSFKQIIPKNPVLSQYPDEFSIELVGYFDNETGVVEGISAKTICKLSALYVAKPIYAEEVAGENAGTFSVSENVEESDEVASQESFKIEQKGRISFGGDQK